MAAARLVGSSTGIMIGLHLVQMAVLARLLDPSDFGLMGMVVVITNFAVLLSDLGVGAALIHRQNVPERHLSSTYWLGVLLGFAVCCLIWVVTSLIVDFYGEPRLEGLLFWAALLFVATPIGQQYQVFLEKRIEFGHLVKVEVASAVLGALVAISTALAGNGAFSLIWGQLANTGAKAVMLMASGWHIWRPQLHFRLSEIKEYIGFGLYQTGQRLLNSVTANADFLLIGVFLGAHALGVYTLAYNLVNIPSSRINAIAARVFFPVFSRAQLSPEKLKTGYLRMQELTSAVNSPLLVGMAVVAPLAIPVVFGSGWQESVLLVQILVVVGIMRALAGTIGPLLLVKGRPSLGFKWSAFVVVVQVPGLYLGALTGHPAGVAAAFAILSALFFVLNYTFLIRVLLGACLREYVASIWPFVWKSTVMAAIIVVFSVSLPYLPEALMLATQVSLGMAIYGALIWRYQRYILLDLRSLVYPTNLS